MADSMAQGAKEFGRGIFQGVTGVVMEVRKAGMKALSMQPPQVQFPFPCFRRCCHKENVGVNLLGRTVTKTHPGLATGPLLENKSVRMLRSFAPIPSLLLRSGSSFSASRQRRILLHTCDTCNCNPFSFPWMCVSCHIVCVGVVVFLLVPLSLTSERRRRGFWASERAWSRGSSASRLRYDPPPPPPHSSSCTAP